MAIRQVLAMTAGEFRNFPKVSGPVGWMSALFSPYGTGLSNLPRQLPEGSLLILSDLTPMAGHDPQRICEDLRQCIQALACDALLLDFQRPWEETLQQLARDILQALPCPVAVSEGYGRDLDCPVFLPPVPPDQPLSDYLAPWQGREIWLELALGGDILTLTEEGCQRTSLPRQTGREGFSDPALHCHYQIETPPGQALFSLWRTHEDLAALLEAAEAYGVTRAVGLWQELGD